MHRFSAFTLIELLIVIGIIAILSVVVLLTLNPAELLRQSRDSNRLSDMETLNKTISLYSTDQVGGSLGNASTTYFSIVDSAATSTAGTDCSGVGLTPPTGWTYHCSASSTLRKVDGTGWIPVSLKSISYGSPLGSSLPIDPINTYASGYYYTYIPGTGTAYALSTAMESQKYFAKSQNDGGYDPSRYETGTNPSLLASSEGLVGWWTFDDGGGTVANDASGGGNGGTLS